jgi:hypothetical protein
MTRYTGLRPLSLVRAKGARSPFETPNGAGRRKGDGVADRDRNDCGSSKVLSVRLSPMELASLDELASAQGVGRAEIIKALLIRGRLPRRVKATVPSELVETRRGLIDQLNRAGKQLERIAELIDAQSMRGQIDAQAIDHAAWQLSAVDARLREALRHDRQD